MISGRAALFSYIKDKVCAYLIYLQLSIKYNNLHVSLYTKMYPEKLLKMRIKTMVTHPLKGWNLDSQ